MPVLVLVRVPLPLPRPLLTSLQYLPLSGIDCLTGDLRPTEMSPPNLAIMNPAQVAGSYLVNLSQFCPILKKVGARENDRQGA